jgi:hypothetical protein
MIGWQQPGALVGLVLAAIPLVIHLLRARRADRRQFPSIRFIRPSNTAAVRLRSPSEWVLLFVRMAIVTAAVLALARPVWLTSSRLARWNALTSRAILVDTSESMRRPGPSGQRAADAAEEAARAEGQSAAHAVRIDSDSLTREVRRAAAWLRDVPPSRREIVIISDAQRGALDATALSAVPADVGIRFVEVGADGRERAVDSFARLGATRTPSRSQQVTLTADSTRVTLKGSDSNEGHGLRLVTSAAEASDAEKLLRAVAMAGAPAPSPAQGLIFGFPGGGQSGGTNQPIAEQWMLRIVIRVQQDEDLQRAARRERATPSGADASKDRESVWTVVARDKDSIPIVTAAASGSEMLIAVGAPISSLLAAATVRSTLAARQGSVAIPEAEVLRIPRAALTARSRPPGPVEHDAWRRASNSDARWFCVIVLALLVVEQWLRSRTLAVPNQKVTRAAA